MTNQVEEIGTYDSKYKNYTQVKVDAVPLNIKDESKSTKLEELNIADEDIIIVELIKDK